MKDLHPFDHMKRKIILYRKGFKNYTIEVKPLCLTRDIPYIHKWVNMDYTRTFWQMEGSFGKTYKHYEHFLNSGKGYALMFFITGEKGPVAQMDFYFSRTDEIGNLYEMQDEDIGVHLLMGPPGKHIPGLTTNVMITGLTYLFTLSTSRIVGEPDVSNRNANELVKRVGFRFVKRVKMSYKTANLYIIERDAFLKRYAEGKTS